MGDSSVHKYTSSTVMELVCFPVLLLHKDMEGGCVEVCTNSAGRAALSKHFKGMVDLIPEDFLDLKHILLCFLFFFF